MIVGARVKADADPKFTTEWKTPTGFVTLDATTIIAIGNAVLAHVHASFIPTGAITDTSHIDPLFTAARVL